MSIYRVKDVVYHWRYGGGVITSLQSHKPEFPISVSFKSGGGQLFTLDGCERGQQGEQPTLSFTHYDLIKGGFSQERPKPEIEKGTPVFVKYHSSIYWHVGLFNGWDDNGYIGVEDLEGITRYFKEYSLENPLI